MCSTSCSGKGSAKMVLRVTFALSLLLVGINHYMTFTQFSGMVSADLGPLGPLGTVWAYVLPALMIVGGLLLLVGRFGCLATLASGIALGSIPVGMLLKTVIGSAELSAMMPLAINAFVWLLVFYFVSKGVCCSCAMCKKGCEKDGGCCKGGCSCGKENCNCGQPRA